MAFFLGRKVPHNRADSPRERILVAIDRIVVGRTLALGFAPRELIAFAVQAIDQLA